MRGKPSYVLDAMRVRLAVVGIEIELGAGDLVEVLRKVLIRARRPRLPVIPVSLFYVSQTPSMTII